MKAVITLLSLIVSIHFSYGQKYLLIDKEWEKRIESNNDLAPLYYGVIKDDQQKNNDKLFVRTAIKKYNTKALAFNHYFVNAWNYFNVGMIDSAIISFNKSFLIDSTNLSLAYSFGDLLTYINPKPDMNNLNVRTYPNYKLIKIFKLVDWDMMIAFGDGMFVDGLKKIHSSGEKYLRFPDKVSISDPFILDSSGCVKVKIRVDDDEGYYKFGIQNGRWVRYKTDSEQIDFEYNLVNGVRNGITISYYDNGTKKEEFFHVNGNLEGEHRYYNPKGQLQRIEYWENNATNSDKTKVFIEE